MFDPRLTWVDRFELVRHIATGGMADVYLARTRGLGGFERLLVLKTLHATDEIYVAMFLDEARLLARLHHHHIVQAYEVGCTDDGLHYLAMEYVNGETVRRVLQEAVTRDVLVPLDTSLTIASSVAAALHHAHHLGIVHRDVSPSNVLVGHDGGVKLIDFGIAKAQDRLAHTNVGYVKGKAGYMAPEQVRGYDVDHRTDIFALGILLYELTTRKRAFPAASAEDQLRQFGQRTIAPPALVIEGYPRELERIVMTALEEEPEDRFADAREMQRALEAFAANLGIVLGAEPIVRTLDTLFAAPPDDLGEDTMPYALIAGLDDMHDLLEISTPTPVAS